MPYLSLLCENKIFKIVSRWQTDNAKSKNEKLTNGKQQYTKQKSAEKGFKNKTYTKHKAQSTKQQSNKHHARHKVAVRKYSLLRKAS